MIFGELFLLFEWIVGEYDFFVSSVKDSLENMNLSYVVINIGYLMMFEFYINFIVFGLRFYEKLNMEVYKYLGLE